MAAGVLTEEDIHAIPDIVIRNRGAANKAMWLTYESLGGLSR